MKASEADRHLDRAYATLEEVAPDRIAGFIRWLHAPSSRWVRLPLGFALVALSFFAYLPIIGIEWLPIGLLLLAQDIPILRKPVARGFVWLEAKWLALRQWWRRRRDR
jgi:hypothetical protein